MNVVVSVSGFELTGELEKYTSNKVTHMAKQIPRKFRAVVTCQVEFTQIHKKDAKFNTCNITFKLGEVELRAKETTLHMYAALDIAAVHIEQQLQDQLALQRKQRVRTRLKRHFHSG